MFRKLVIFPIFVSAWLIVLVHGVIPHHHHEHYEITACGDCHSHSHDHESEDHNNLWHSLTSHHNHEESICHFSVDILTQIALDQTFIPCSSDFKLSIISNEYKVDWFDPVYIIKPLYIHNSQLRAPPVG